MLYQTASYYPFLIGCLLVYWLVLRNAPARTWWLALSSSGFIGIAQLHTVSFEYASAATAGVLLLTLLVYRMGELLRRNSGLLPLLLCIAIPLTVLIVFKYLQPLGDALGYPLNIITPMGVSYYTFKFVSYLIECSRGNYKDAKFSTFVAYIMFFPMFSAGPIERYHNFAEQVAGSRFSWATISSGLERILIGIAFKFVISDFLVAAFLPPSQALADNLDQLGTHQILLASFARFLRTYFDFAGYTHMVIGVGLLFGIKLMENFNAPLLRQNLAQFWRAWHISLSSWARDYIYFPLLGKYRSTALALIATMLTIGVWHEASPGWIMWGLHHGIGLVLLSEFHRWAERRDMVQKLRDTVGWRVVAMFTTWWYVSIGYGLTFLPYDVGTSLTIYSRLLSVGLLS